MELATHVCAKFRFLKYSRKLDVTYGKSASFLSIVTLNDGNGRAPCRNSGFEPLLFAIMKEGQIDVILNKGFVFFI